MKGKGIELGGGVCTGKEDGSVQEETKVLGLLPGRKNSMGALCEVCNDMR